jgi:uncharacterized protein YlxP (DUF503 family)
VVVGLVTLQLRIPASSSLKDKRQVLRSVIARVHREFNVSIAEVAQQDSHQLATLALACVSSDRAYVQGLMERAVKFITGAHDGLVLLDYETELI